MPVGLGNLANDGVSDTPRLFCAAEPLRTENFKKSCMLQQGHFGARRLVLLITLDNIAGKDPRHLASSCHPFLVSVWQR